MLAVASPKRGAEADAESLAGVLRAERDALVAFVGLLRNEQEILVRGDAGGLASLANAKEDLIAQLGLFGQQRNDRLAALGLPASSAGMASLLNSISRLSAEAGPLWQAILAHAETARQLNHNNGILIDSGLKQNRLKLGALRTAAADGVYSADGLLGPLRAARSLTQV